MKIINIYIYITLTIIIYKYNLLSRNILYKKEWIIFLPNTPFSGKEGDWSALHK